MTKRTWHKGPPPSVGWYNASVQSASDVWRWWNGKHWSEYVVPSCSKEFAGLYAMRLASDRQGEIQWTTYWPKNARVPDTRNLKGYK